MSATPFTPLLQAHAAGLPNASVRVWLAQDGIVTNGTRKDGKAYRKKEVVFADESGQCTGMCWDDWVDTIRPGVIYLINNPHWKNWGGKRNMSLSFHCTVQEEGQQPGTLGSGAAAAPAPYQTPAPAAQPPPTSTPAPQQRPPSAMQTAPQAAGGAPAPPGFVPAAGGAQPEQETQPPKPGPGNDRVRRMAGMLHDIEADVTLKLWELDQRMPDRPRVGMYVKLIWDIDGARRMNSHLPKETDSYKSEVDMVKEAEAIKDEAEAEESKA